MGKRLTKITSVPLPEKVREDLSAEVMRKIVARRWRRRLGAGVGIAACLLTALVFLIATWQTAPRPKEMEQRSVPSSHVSDPMYSEEGVVMNEEDLLEEIEALRELGLWDEEDEVGIGIEWESSFEELDYLFEAGGFAYPLLSH